jgi:hypothetical protein
VAPRPPHGGKRAGWGKKLRFPTRKLGTSIKKLEPPTGELELSIKKLGFPTWRLKPRAKKASLFTKKASLFTKKASLFTKKASLFARKASLFAKKASLFTRKASLFAKKASLFTRKTSLFTRKTDVSGGSDRPCARRASCVSRCGRPPIGAGRAGADGRPGPVDLVEGGRETAPGAPMHPDLVRDTPDSRSARIAARVFGMVHARLRGG